MLFPLRLFYRELTPLKSSPVHQDIYSSYWCEGKLVYVVVKQKTLTLAETKLQLEKFRRLLNGKHFCAIMDFSRVSDSSADVRDYITQQLPTLFNAVAFVTQRSEREFADTGSLQFPVKTFHKELDALCWVNQYLAN